MSMRKALVVGIDHYTHISGLYGCVNDAQAVRNILERNSDGSVNFSVLPLSGTENVAVNRADLRESVRELFAHDSEIALFYFAGHGHIESAGGYLCTTDSRSGDDGLSLSDVLAFANNSRA
jgi:uncharacterized caspase-like protein